MDVLVLAVALASIAALLVGGVWYAVFGQQVAALRPAGAEQAPPGLCAMTVEFARCVVVATVVAGLVAALEITSVWPGLVLALVLWVGFPLVLFAGAVMWERVPWRLAALHAGDWLAKLLVVALIVVALR